MSPDPCCAQLHVQVFLTIEPNLLLVGTLLGGDLDVNEFICR